MEDDRTGRHTVMNILLSFVFTIIGTSLFSFEHGLEAISSLGELIALEDGSQWRIAERHTGVVLKWEPEDPIEIFPYTDLLSWIFPSKSYTLHNFADGTEAYAYLYSGPEIGGDHTKRIASFRDGNGLALTDGSEWIAKNIRGVTGWQEGEYIIIGSDAAETILINVNQNTYAHVKKR